MGRMNKPPQTRNYFQMFFLFLCLKTILSYPTHCETLELSDDLLRGVFMPLTVVPLNTSKNFTCKPNFKLNNDLDDHVYCTKTGKLEFRDKNGVALEEYPTIICLRTACTVPKAMYKPYVPGDVLVLNNTKLDSKNDNDKNINNDGTIGLNKNVSSINSYEELESIKIGEKFTFICGKNETSNYEFLIYIKCRIDKIEIATKNQKTGEEIITIVDEVVEVCVPRKDYCYFTNVMIDNFILPSRESIIMLPVNKEDEDDDVDTVRVLGKISATEILDITCGKQYIRITSMAQYLRCKNSGKFEIILENGIRKEQSHLVALCKHYHYQLTSWKVLVYFFVVLVMSIIVAFIYLEDSTRYTTILY